MSHRRLRRHRRLLSLAPAFALSFLSKLSFPRRAACLLGSKAANTPGQPGAAPHSSSAWSRTLLGGFRRYQSKDGCCSHEATDPSLCPLQPTNPQMMAVNTHRERRGRVGEGLRGSCFVWRRLNFNPDRLNVVGHSKKPFFVTLA